MCVCNRYDSYIYNYLCKSVFCYKINLNYQGVERLSSIHSIYSHSISLSLFEALFGNWVSSCIKITMCFRLWIYHSHAAYMLNGLLVMPPNVLMRRGLTSARKFSSRYPNRSISSFYSSWRSMGTRGNSLSLSLKSARSSK